MPTANTPGGESGDTRNIPQVPNDENASKQEGSFRNAKEGDSRAEQEKNPDKNIMIKKDEIREEDIDPEPANENS